MVYSVFGGGIGGATMVDQRTVRNGVLVIEGDTEGNAANSDDRR